VSSTIVGFEDVREETRRAIDGLGFAESWLFEFHGTASGGTSEEQYLAYAATCDVFCILVGDSVGPGTIAEYQVAVADNPHKVLPFIYGPSGPSSEALRRELRRKHRYKRVDSVSRIPEVVAQAVGDFLLSGRIAKSGLSMALDARTKLRRSQLGVPDGFDFDVHVASELNVAIDPSALLVPAARSVLRGRAGSGKSDMASKALTAATGADDRLPVLVDVAPGSLEDWVADAFHAVRFAPGPELVRQYMRDGRLAIAIDGIDDLSPEERIRGAREIDRAARRYPRLGLLVASRLTALSLSEQFIPYSMQPLDDTRLEALFAARDPGGLDSSVGTRMLELARLPFWATLIARFGSGTTRALELIEKLVETRIAFASHGDAQQGMRLRSALRALAYAMRPGYRIGLDTALGLLTAWLMSDSGRARQGDWSADRLVELARERGLLHLEGQDVSFPHQLIAAFLAAEHLVSGLGEADVPGDHATDDDLLAFAAALSSQNESLHFELLRELDIFQLAQLLRLGVRHRSSDVASGTMALASVFAHLDQLTSAWEAPDAHLSALESAGYYCFIVGRQGPSTGLTRGLSINEWLAGCPSATITCWRGNPFERLSPVELAGSTILNNFKSRWLGMPGQPSPPHGHDGAAITSRSTLHAELLSFVRRTRDARARLLHDVGLAGDWLEGISGEPRVRVSRERDAAYYVVEWGADSAVVEEVEGQVLGHGVERIVADPDAVAYADLQRDLEARLGSAMFSQAVRTPSSPWSL
jgi:hypothetical protein